MMQKSLHNFYTFSIEIDCIDIYDLKQKNTVLSVIEKAISERAKEPESNLKEMTFKSVLPTFICM